MFHPTLLVVLALVAPILWGVFFGATRHAKMIELIAKTVGWAWAFIAGVGGLVLPMYRLLVDIADTTAGPCAVVQWEDLP